MRETYRSLKPLFNDERRFTLREILQKSANQSSLSNSDLWVIRRDLIKALAKLHKDRAAHGNLTLDVIKVALDPTGKPKSASIEQLSRSRDITDVKLDSNQLLNITQAEDVRALGLIFHAMVCKPDSAECEKHPNWNQAENDSHRFQEWLMARRNARDFSENLVGEMLEPNIKRRITMATALYRIGG